jgi:hypothetical protein
MLRCTVHFRDGSRTASRQVHPRKPPPRSSAVASANRWPSGEAVNRSSSSESSHWDKVPNKKVCSSQLRLRPRKVQIALGTKYVALGLALVSLRATRAGPVCLIEFPEQLSEPVREMILWRKLILQRFT